MVNDKFGGESFTRTGGRGDKGMVAINDGFNGPFLKITECKIGEFMKVFIIVRVIKIFISNIEHINRKIQIYLY